MIELKRSQSHGHEGGSRDRIIVGWRLGAPERARYLARDSIGDRGGAAGGARISAGVDPPDP
jgi:hypothetical protein